MKSFNERCYDILREVPAGKVTTYKEIANALGTRAYKAVGNAMNRNPYAPQVPCHRVVNSNGSLGGYASGDKVKTELLKREGIEVRDSKIVNFEKYFLRF